MPKKQNANFCKISFLALKIVLSSNSLLNPMNNLTNKEIKEIVHKAYIRGALMGMLIMAVLYGIHAIVLALY